MPVLQAKDISISFCQYTKGLEQSYQKVITSLHLDVHAGEVVAIVGSSGSGKSLLAHSILGILPDNCQLSGELYYKGAPLSEVELSKLRGKEISLVPQSINYLDPLMKVGKQVETSVPKEKGNKKSVVRQLFSKFGLAPKVEEMYPFQLSGGMARRAIVSAAIAGNPKLLVADEPTPGLDEEGVKEALSFFKKLSNQGHSIIMITHDLEAALQIADRIVVFYAGTTVEMAPVRDFAGAGENLRHPYSKALWNALPQNGFQPLAGSQPLHDQLPKGCFFGPRCSLKTEMCEQHLPELRGLRDGSVRCIHAT
ncbi:peptide ABC transporter ATP-binding protein [Desulfuribacillus alkaliarsenatis]|uniref:Nickel import system ATP-binding protein NikD n=1 Tax=Desulfuribacillus alkaliarsenatis TaxID=766136 RepID=A0A1E5G2L4_9FIRM|nr:peptide ABC transporter ATP-binding protein [Desulfuribacillus alkaliarsenatis]